VRIRGVDDKGSPVDEIHLECLNCGQTMKYDLLKNNGGEA
jgi:hypothetical protein